MFITLHGLALCCELVCVCVCVCVCVSLSVSFTLGHSIMLMSLSGDVLNLCEVWPDLVLGAKAYC